MIDREILRPIVAKNIARKRRQKKLSQEALAKLVGLSREQINRIENGHDNPEAATLFGIADALEVQTDDLRQLS